MTRNQIAFQELKEAQRSNLAREAETNRSNVANEMLKSFQNMETKRSNIANEALKAAQNVETNRSNVAGETLAADQLQHNKSIDNARLDLEKTRWIFETIPKWIDAFIPG